MFAPDEYFSALALNIKCPNSINGLIRSQTSQERSKSIRLAINGQEIESLSVTLTDAEGRNSSHSISARALVRALAGELGTSMREVSLKTTRAQKKELEKW